MSNVSIAYVASVFNSFTNEWDWIYDPFVEEAQALAVCRSYNDPEYWREDGAEDDSSEFTYVPTMLIRVEAVDGIWTPREWTPIGTAS